MKTTVEYSEAEFIALVTLAEKFTDRIFRLIEAEQAQTHAYRTSARTQAVAVEVPSAAPSAASEENEFGFASEPASAPVPTEALPKWAKSRDMARETIARGHQEFCRFTKQWERNLGVEGADQPDRAELVRALSNGPSAGAVMAFLESKGGLLHALDSIINLGEGESEEQRRARVNLLGSTMCQISSIFFPDFTAFYEHVDIYRKRKGGK